MSTSIHVKETLTSTMHLVIPPFFAMLFALLSPSTQTKPTASASQPQKLQVILSPQANERKGGPKHKIDTFFAIVE